MPPAPTCSRSFSKAPQTWPANQTNGTLPLGQLNLTTEVENFPGWPFADNAALQQLAKSALPEDRFANLKHFLRKQESPYGKRAAFGPELMELMRQQAVNFGTRIITDDIVKVDLKQPPFTLTSRDNGTVEAQAVIIATGARANYLGLPSEDRFKNNGVSACAVCDGALPRFRNKPLVVVGGGDSAVEEATYLTKFASQVFMVVRRHELRASKIMQRRALENPKITMKWNRTLDEVLGTDQVGVTGARIKSTVDQRRRRSTSSGVFLAIGHTPNTDFLGGQLQARFEGLRRLDDAAADLHERGRRLRGGRRGRQLLPPGDHRGGNRLPGRPRRGTLAGGEGISLIQAARLSDSV